MGTYCQTPEMFYKRITPSASFSPYPILLQSWVEGTDNRHGIDFDLYSTPKDALVDTNKFTYCDYPSDMRAFGNCGATAAVYNNYIGTIGTALGL